MNAGTRTTLSNNALAAALRCRGGATADLQFVEYLMEIPFRCPDANRELLGNLLVGKAEIDQAKRFKLLSGQTRFGRHASFLIRTRERKALGEQQGGYQTRCCGITNITDRVGTVDRINMTLVERDKHVTYR
jgi:hypothetical protein